MSFNISNWLNNQLAEDITYNGNPIRAIVTRKTKSSYPIKGLNNQVYNYNIVIEVSADDVAEVTAGRANGDTVICDNLKGTQQTFRVLEHISYDKDSNSHMVAIS